MIKVEYICHACLLITVNGKRILTDPWIYGSSFANCLWLYPPPKSSAKDIGKVDYIYFSHAHEDHFQLESIKEIIKYNRNTKIIIPKFKQDWFTKLVKKVGFKNILVIAHNEKLQISKNSSIKIFINDLGEIDSSLLVRSDSDEIFLQTDNLMSLKESKRIGKNNNIFISFLIPSSTGIFPGLFEFDFKKTKQMALKKKNAFFKYISQTAKNLNSNFYIPYANDLCYFDDLFFLNKLNSFEKKDFVFYLKKKLLKSFIMNSSDNIIINKRKVIKSKISNIVLNRDEDLSIYAKTMFDEYNYKKRNEINYSKNDPYKELKRFIEKICTIDKKWKFKKYNIQWVFNNYKNDEFTFNHKINNSSKNNDLKITIPFYRIQNLIKNYYPMGFLSFHNGGVRVKRKNLSYTKEESSYFEHLYRLKF